jgi:lipopolysaccharide O-acetyltransferase
MGQATTFQAPGPWIVGGGRIALGNAVFGRPFVRLEAITSSRSPARGPILTVEDRAYLGFHVSVFATRGVTIGRDVYLNGHVTIYDHYPPLDSEDAGAPGPADERVGEVSLGDQSWIGWGAVVMPGVRIGTHSVLGANSVAIEDVPDHCVAVGNPAVVVRRYDAPSKRWVSVEPDGGGP